ncbi:MAG: helix-turn-helix transcriptional regulator [Microbacteriaceae bacterium]|nr:helix-turn-helix transcriptional regulator [Microbacteriaceae bacterium]
MAVDLDELRRLRRARDRMDREFAAELDVAGLARGAFMSAAHFSRRFRDAYGETPYAYLMTRRIERAKALLRAGAGVTAACHAVGCTSLGSFSASFTGLVGVTPSRYRELGAAEADGLSSCQAMRTTRPRRGRRAAAERPAESSSFGEARLAPAV